MDTLSLIGGLTILHVFVFLILNALFSRLEGRL